MLPCTWRAAARGSPAGCAGVPPRRPHLRSVSRLQLERVRPLVVLAALAALPGVLAGQARGTVPDSSRRDSAAAPLSGVTITAGRSPTAVGGTGAVIVAIDSLRLTPSAPLEEALRGLPFIVVRQNSRGEAELSVRGSDSRQAAVLFDGLPLSIGWDHRADPSAFPLSGVGRIVIVRGLSTLLQGPNSLGGVIELGLASDRAEHLAARQLSLRVGGDQVGGSAFQADLAQPVSVGRGHLTVRTGLGFRTRPAVALSGEVRDPYTTDGARRSNSDLDQRDGYLAARYLLPGGAWVGGSVSAYALDRGVMPELHVAAPRFWRYPRQQRQLALVTAGTARRRTPFGAGDMEVVVGRNTSSMRIERFDDARYDSVAGRESGDERTTTARLLADHSLGRGELRTALTYAEVDYEEGLEGVPPADYRQRLWSGGVEVEQPLGGSLRLSGGAVLDVSTTPRSAGREALGRLSEWGGRIGLSSLAFDARWRVHAAVNRRARFAALRELYSGALDRFQPNPLLRPEILTGSEVGATLLAPRAQFQGVLFLHRMRDAVVRTTLANRKFMRINRDQIRSAGIELLGGWSAGAATLSADALVQHVRVADPAVSGSARRPENLPELRLGGDAVFPLGAGIRARLGVNHTGRQYCLNPDTGTNDVVPSQSWGDAGVERTFTLRPQGLLSRLLASLGVENLGDDAVYDQCGLPQPGRTIRFGLALH